MANPYEVQGSFQAEYAEACGYEPPVRGGRPQLSMQSGADLAQLRETQKAGGSETYYAGGGQPAPGDRVSPMWNEGLCGTVESVDPLYGNVASVVWDGAAVDAGEFERDSPTVSDLVLRSR